MSHLAVERDPGPGPGWIISAREDLCWFQGSALAGVALLTAFVMLPGTAPGTFPLGHPAVLLVFAWGWLFDGTHVWGTYARSYLAPDPASRARLPGPWVFGWLLVGPAAAALDAALCTPSPWAQGQAGPIFRGFMLFAYLWAFWHGVRQHYGFLMLYRKRAGETDPAGARFDQALLWAGCMYPYLRFAVGDSYRASGLPVLVPLAWAGAARAGLDLGAGLGVAALLWGAARGGPPRWGPKHGFLAVVIGLHLLAFGLLHDLLAIMAVMTIFHDLQYHRIVWQYERGLGREPSGGLVPYLGFGLAFGFAWYGSRILGPAWVGPGLAANALIGLGWGVAFHHYHVDGLIWRVGRDREVAGALARGARPGAGVAP